MKWELAICIVWMISYSAVAEIINADSSETVASVLEDNKDGTVALFFTDSSTTQGSEGSFWSGIATSITNIFTGGDEDAQEERLNAINEDSEQDVAMVKIDVSQGDFQELQDQYDVTTVPFIVVLKRGITVLREVPTQETHDRILEVMNISPEAVHEDATGAVIIEQKKYDEETPEPERDDSTETTEDQTEEVSAEDDETTSEKHGLVTRRIDMRPQYTPPQRYTVAPVVRQPIVERPEPEHVNPDDRTKYTHHQCYEADTYDDEAASHWRDSQFYISELDDYELPEDWWRQGYSPITDPSKQQARTRPDDGVVPAPYDMTPPPIVVVEPERPIIYREPAPVVQVKPQFPRFSPPPTVVATNTATRPVNSTAHVTGFPYGSHTHVARAAPGPVATVSRPIEVANQGPIRAGPIHEVHPASPHYHRVSDEGVTVVASPNRNQTQTTVRTSGPTPVRASGPSPVRTSGPTPVRQVPQGTARAPSTSTTRVESTQPTRV